VGMSPARLHEEFLSFLRGKDEKSRNMSKEGEPSWVRRFAGRSARLIKIEVTPDL